MGVQGEETIGIDEGGVSSGPAGGIEILKRDVVLLIDLILGILRGRVIIRIALVARAQDQD